VTVKALDIGRASSPLHDRPHLRRLDQVDPYLLIATLLLIGYGLVMTYSVTAESRTFTGDPMQFVVRGAIWAAIGVAAMVIVAMFDYAWLGTFAPLIYLLMLGLLVVVLAIGRESLGAQRAVNFGGLSFQFSEVAKVLAIVVLAKYFADRSDRIGSPLVIAGGLAMLGPAVALVYKQPDLGTSLVFIAIFFGIAFLAGARVWQLVGLVAVAHLVSAQALPAGAAPRVPQSVLRSAGGGLEHHPVAHRGRIRSGDGEGAHGRDAVAPRLPADRGVGLRLRRAR